MGKGRPKFARRGKFVNTYTPKETADYESRVKECYVQETRNGVVLILPVSVDIKAFFPIPKSTPKYKIKAMLNGAARPTKKPDFDNIGKIICDALNGLAYPDDSHIVDGAVHKFYSDEPRVEVTLTEIA
jgi:Holliday junction resolvase RusA-like endonuclease